MLIGIKFQDILSDKRILDIGCGRGGGCKIHLKLIILVAFLAKYYEPEDSVGIDVSSHQIHFANEIFSQDIDSLSYLVVSFLTKLTYRVMHVTFNLSMNFRTKLSTLS